MTTPTPTAPPAAAPEGAPQPPATPPAAPAADGVRTPPWERNGTNPDPMRAWQLAENRRLELEGIRAERDRLSQEAEERRLASLSAQERAETERDQARADAEAARSEATRFRVAAQHGILADNIDLLGSGSEQEMTARAARVAAMQAAGQAPPPATPPPPPGSGRPVESLRPGATPSDQPTEDDALYAQLYGPQARS